MNPLTVFCGCCVLLSFIVGTPLNFHQSHGIRFSSIPRVPYQRDHRRSVDHPFVISGTPKPHPNPSGNGGELFFPGESSTTDGSNFGIRDNWDGTTYTDNTCSPPKGKIDFYGNCHKILSQGPCPSNYWIILDNRGMPYCAQRQCPIPGQVPFGKSCVNADSPSVCLTNEVLYVEYSGYTYCDCEEFFVFHKGKCVEENSQGTCGDHEHIEVDATGKTTCQQNPCRSTTQVLNPEDHMCYTKDYIGRCKEEEGYLQTFTKGGEARCDSTDIRNIFEVPALNSCPRGSKRDHTNRCRETFRIERRNPFSFRVPVQHTASTRFGTTCPPNYVRYPNSSCQMPNNLFGR